jgi:hypothetical protein
MVQMLRIAVDQLLTFPGYPLERKRLEIGAKKLTMLCDLYDH